MRADVITKLMNEKFPDKDLLGLEIGCYQGDFDSAILVKMPKLHMVSIEPLPDYHKIFSNLAANDMTSTPNKAIYRFKLIESSSDEAIKFLRREYDFIFIDGLHTYEQTRKDILNYWQVVKSGGLLCGHNYDAPNNPCAAHPGVSQAVVEIFGLNNYQTGEDTTWWKWV